MRKRKLSTQVRELEAEHQKLKVDRARDSTILYYARLACSAYHGAQPETSPEWPWFLKMYGEWQKVYLEPLENK